MSASGKQPAIPWKSTFLSFQPLALFMSVCFVILRGNFHECNLKQGEILAAIVQVLVSLAEKRKNVFFFKENNHHNEICPEMMRDWHL